MGAETAIAENTLEDHAGRESHEQQIAAAIEAATRVHEDGQLPKGGYEEAILAGCPFAIMAGREGFNQAATSQEDDDLLLELADEQLEAVSEKPRAIQETISEKKKTVAAERSEAAEGPKKVVHAAFSDDRLELLEAAAIQTISQRQQKEPSTVESSSEGATRVDIPQKASALEQATNAASDEMHRRTTEQIHTENVLSPALDSPMNPAVKRADTIVTNLQIEVPSEKPALPQPSLPDRLQRHPNISFDQPDQPSESISGTINEIEATEVSVSAGDQLADEAMFESGYEFHDETVIGDSWAEVDLTEATPESVEFWSVADEMLGTNEDNLNEHVSGLEAQFTEADATQDVVEQLQPTVVVDTLTRAPAEALDALEATDGSEHAVAELVEALERFEQPIEPLMASIEAILNVETNQASAAQATDELQVTLTQFLESANRLQGLENTSFRRLIKEVEALRDQMLQDLERKEDAQYLSERLGTREFRQHVRRAQSAIQQAIAKARSIGKSLVRMYQSQQYLTSRV